MANRVEKPEKGSRAYLEGKVTAGRSSLLLVLIFTVVNLIFLLLDMNTYFLFSASLPYYLTAICMGVDMAINGYAQLGTFTLGALGLSAVILGIFLLCWLLSKKHSGWLIAALVLFVLDTICLVGCTLWLLENPLENLVDFLFHFWVIWELAQAIHSAGKLRDLSSQEGRNPPVGPELQ